MIINTNSKIHDEIKSCFDSKMESSGLQPNINRFKVESKLKKEVKANAKLTHCYYCGKSCTSFCNSHSTPQFVLKNLNFNENKADNKRLVDSFVMLGDVAENYKYVGVKNATTFQMICRECDSKIFSNYENPANYLTIPSNAMMNEIALKNYLCKIAQLRFNIELYTLGEKLTNIKKDGIEADKLRLERYEEKVRLIKDNCEFDLIYYNKLDYVVPIAVQDAINLVYDLEGNDIDYSENKMEEMHICIFPLKTQSILIMFKDKKCSSLNGFIDQFQKLNPKRKLEILNYIIFVYTDRYLLSPTIDDSIFGKLENIANYPTGDEESVLKFQKINTTPNLLLDIF